MVYRGVARLSSTTPQDASPAPASASSTPAGPPWSRSPSRDRPITAAASGLASVTIASGAPRPPRYAVCDSSSPPAAKAATSSATPITCDAEQRTGAVRHGHRHGLCERRGDPGGDAGRGRVPQPGPGARPGQHADQRRGGTRHRQRLGTRSARRRAPGPDAVTRIAARPSSVSAVPLHSTALTRRPASRAPMRHRGDQGERAERLHHGQRTVPQGHDVQQRGRRVEPDRPPPGAAAEQPQQRPSRGRGRRAAPGRPPRRRRRRRRRGTGRRRSGRRSSARSHECLLLGSVPVRAAGPASRPRRGGGERSEMGVTPDEVRGRITASARPSRAVATIASSQ